MIRRKIIQIDEKLCNGCGECVTACAEGAIRIVDGKARLVSDKYCDGLGACLGECPQGAIRIIEREAEQFDEAAVKQAMKAATPKSHVGCPGAAVMSMLPVVDASLSAESSPECKEALTPGPDHSVVPAKGRGESKGLANWPVQLHLVPPHAPFLKGADVVLAADCVPAAMAEFHSRFLGGRPLLIGCPKLDDVRAYVEKVAAILRVAEPRSLTVAHMQVPCCTGLMRIAAEAKVLAASEAPIFETVVSIRGEVMKTAEPA
jgi:Pyruvate/2-oxoacid:ferredoxin oxidoreductase delta subunit